MNSKRYEDPCPVCDVLSGVCTLIRSRTLRLPLPLPPSPLPHHPRRQRGRELQREVDTKVIGREAAKREHARRPEQTEAADLLRA